MLDDLDRIRDNSHLLDLFSHYANLGKIHQEVWQNRLMEMAEVEPRAIVKLHGELIAFGWIEQNTGEFPICYRITPAGLKAMRAVRAQQQDENVLAFPARPAGKRKGRRAA